MIAAPTGSGKSTAAAGFIAGQAPALWLANRHEDVAAAAAMIEAKGGVVGRPVPLTGRTHGVANCLMPDIIKAWQAKGYNYQVGVCCHRRRDGTPLCPRQGDLERCPYLQGLENVAKAPIAVTTKAFARRPNFFSTKPHDQRRTIVLDEDPISLLRPAVEASRDDLERYLQACKVLQGVFLKGGDRDGYFEAKGPRRNNLVNSRMPHKPDAPAKGYNFLLARQACVLTAQCHCPTYCCAAPYWQRFLTEYGDALEGER